MFDANNEMMNVLTGRFKPTYRPATIEEARQFIAQHEQKQVPFADWEQATTFMLDHYGTRAYKMDVLYSDRGEHYSVDDDESETGYRDDIVLHIMVYNGEGDPLLPNPDLPDNEFLLDCFNYEHMNAARMLVSQFEDMRNAHIPLGDATYFTDQQPSQEALTELYIKVPPSIQPRYSPSTDLWTPNNS